MYIKNLSFLLSLYVSQAAANAVAVVPTITPAAVLPRQVDQNFVGWYSDPTSGWSIETCGSGSTLTQSGTYAACCTTVSDCTFTTGCRNGSIALLADGSSTECTSSTAYGGVQITFTACVTASIYENINDQVPQEAVVCWYTAENYSLYRSTPTSTTPNSTPFTTTLTPAPTTTIPPPNNSGPSSKAWIAGPVVGGVAFIVLVAMGIWIFLLKKHQRQARASGVQPQIAEYAAEPPNQPYYPGPHGPMAPAAHVAYNPAFSPPPPSGSPQAAPGQQWQEYASAYVPAKEDGENAPARANCSQSQSTTIPLALGEVQHPRPFLYELPDIGIAGAGTQNN